MKNRTVLHISATHSSVPGVCADSLCTQIVQYCTVQCSAVHVHDSKLVITQFDVGEQTYMYICVQRFN